jgi:VanZ family protein
MPLLRRVDLWLPPLLLMAVIFYLSAQPDLNSGLGWLDTVGRKLIHAAVYALLCFLWWRLLRSGMPSHRAALVAFVISSLYAISDEYHQSFIEGRHGSPIDWAIDSAGAGLAALRLGTRRRTAA